MHHLNIAYSVSTFDTDPFEPQANGVKTVFPIKLGASDVVELPYSMPQDFTLFILMREKSIDIWLRKLDWIAERGGMVLLNTHPDYMCFNGGKCSTEEYPVELYEKLLSHIRENYQKQYWLTLAEEAAEYYKSSSH